MDFREAIAALLREHGVEPELLEVPPDPALGDYALPCFTLGDPLETAREIAAAVTADFLERVEARGPYVNFSIRPDERARSILTGILDATDDSGGGREGETVMIEYSQPNTHKAFHVGHVRGTSLGESLARILRHAGHTVVQANYSGDTGAHIAKWLWYYTTRDRSRIPEERIEEWIAGIYVRAVREIEERPELEEEVNEVLRRLESREDTQLNETYEKTRQLSIEAFKSIYDELHAHFDVWYFEGEVEKAAKAISRRLVREGIARVDDGATIVDLKEQGLGVWVLLRKDGTALYSAKDLALAERKFKEFHIDRNVYVVGHAQSLHFRQLFATLQLMRFPAADKCYHLSFSEVRLPDGKMSSRTGRNLLYSEMREEIAKHATREVRVRHEDWTGEQVARVVSKVVVGALKWEMLAVSPGKVITFDPKRATRFEGETGPYVQYTYARACSILRKASGERGDGSTLTQGKEQQLLRLLGGFPGVIARAAAEYQPSILANYTMMLAKAFNSFYHDCKVIGAENEKDRVALVEATVKVLGSCLDLLAIDAPEVM